MQTSLECMHMAFLLCRWIIRQRGAGKRTGHGIIDGWPSSARSHDAQLRGTSGTDQGSQPHVWSTWRQKVCSGVSKNSAGNGQLWTDQWNLGAVLSLALLYTILCVQFVQDVPMGLMLEEITEKFVLYCVKYYEKYKLIIVIVLVEECRFYFLVNFLRC